MAAPMRRAEILSANWVPVVKIQAAYGRLYVNGTHTQMLQRLPGATVHEKTKAIQLSLTLESLRAIRRALGVSQQTMAAYCTPDVLRWAKAAGVQEKRMLDLHRRISDGYRGTFHWHDARAGTIAGPDASSDDVRPEIVDYVRNVYVKRDPFAHQSVMATVANELDGCAFLCEPGTGKTRPSIEVLRAKLERGGVDYGMIVCPKGVMNTWIREVIQWSEGLEVVPLRGPIKERCRIVEAYAQNPVAGATKKIFLVNYEALAFMHASFQMLLSRKRVFLVLDEMHKCKNPKAKTTQSAMELAKVATARLGLTGTPVINGAEDIWSQWYFIDLGVTFGANFVQFRREFFNEYAWSWDIDPKDGALDQIGRRLLLRGLRYRKEDCLDLPPKMYEVVDVEMTREQSTAYDEMKEWLIAWLRGDVSTSMPTDADEDDDGTADGEARAATAANQLVAIMRLTQITSGFIPTEDGTVHHFSPNPKLDTLEDLVREYVAGGRSVIVWATYKHDVANILARLRDLRPVRIDGTQQGVRGQKERDEAERSFQAGETKVLVGNPKAGGLGLNLQRASVAIYYSQSYSLEARTQSEDRCHRSGSQQHRSILYVDLSCTGTIDETVRTALASKKDVAAAVVDLRRALGV